MGHNVSHGRRCGVSALRPILFRSTWSSAHVCKNRLASLSLRQLASFDPPLTAVFAGCLLCVIQDLSSKGKRLPGESINRCCHERLRSLSGSIASGLVKNRRIDGRGHWSQRFGRLSSVEQGSSLDLKVSAVALMAHLIISPSKLSRLFLVLFDLIGELLNPSFCLLQLLLKF